MLSQYSRFLITLADQSHTVTFTKNRAALSGCVRASLSQLTVSLGGFLAVRLGFLVLIKWIYWHHRDILAVTYFSPKLIRYQS